MILFIGEAMIESKAGLKRFAEEFSSRFLGGAPMWPDSSRDEEPAMSANILGNRLLLYEVRDGFVVQVNTYPEGDEDVAIEDMREIDLSRFLEERLAELGFKVKKSKRRPKTQTHDRLLIGEVTVESGTGLWRFARELSSKFLGGAPMWPDRIDEQEALSANLLGVTVLFYAVQEGFVIQVDTRPKGGKEDAIEEKPKRDISLFLEERLSELGFKVKKSKSGPQGMKKSR